VQVPAADGRLHRVLFAVQHRETEMIWRFIEWLQRILGDPGTSFEPSDDMDSLPEPEDETGK
jgi:hypothetical protein